MTNKPSGRGPRSQLGPVDPKAIWLQKRFVEEGRKTDARHRGQGLLSAVAERARASLARLRLRAGMWRHRLAGHLSIKLHRALARVNRLKPAARARRGPPHAKVGAPPPSPKTERRPAKSGPQDAV